MPSVKFRKEHFLGKTAMPPTWYLFEVGEFTEKASKDGDSMNFWGNFKVAEGEYANTELRHCFNEKAIEYAGGAADYMACFTQDIEKLNGMEVLDALKATTGRRVKGAVEWDPNFKRNQIKDWRSADE